MDHSRIVKKSWQNILDYRALWIFGMILAIVTFSWETAALVNRDDSSPGITIQRGDDESFGEAFERTVDEEFEKADRQIEQLLQKDLNLAVSIGLSTLLPILVAISIMLFLLGRVARYVSETALIKMVYRHQESGQKQTVRQGLRMGWSRTAWRLFFIEISINLVAVAGSLLLFALIFSPIPLWTKGSEGLALAFGLLTAALFFLGILVVIVLALTVNVLKSLSRRACAIENLGITASIYRGMSLLKPNIKRILPSVLIMIALNTSWPLLTGFFLILLLAIGLLIGGLPAILWQGLGGIQTAGTIPLIIAVFVGVLLLLLIFIAPLAWLGGMKEVFLSSMWTLVYRELGKLEEKEQEIPPEIDIPPLTLSGDTTSVTREEVPR